MNWWGNVEGRWLCRLLLTGENPDRLDWLGLLPELEPVVLSTVRVGWRVDELRTVTTDLGDGWLEDRLYRGSRLMGVERRAARVGVSQ